MGAPEVEFDITYHSEYGIVPTKIQQITGYPYTEEHLPVLTYQGKEFAGWYYTSTFDEGTDVQVGEYASIDHEHLYAKWISPSVSSVLTNLADEIRVLSGATEPLGLVEMATNVNDANDEVADQTDLIAQVASALQGKSIPGGGGEDVTAETETYTDLLTDLEAAVNALPDAGSGGSGGTVQMCTVTIKAKFAISATGYVDYLTATGYASEALPTASNSIQIQCLANSILTLGGNGFSSFTVSDGAKLIRTVGPASVMHTYIVYVTGDSTLQYKGA